VSLTSHQHQHRGVTDVVITAVVAVAVLALAPAVAVATVPFCDRHPTHHRCQPVAEQWREVFHDDFTEPAAMFPGATYSDRWDVYPDGWPDSTGHGTYMPSRVLSVHDGALDWWVRTEDGAHLVAAAVAKGLNLTYGRYAVRFRADFNQHGYKIAFLLWPDSENWADGEINFPEGNLTTTIEGYSHCVGDPTVNCLAVVTDATFTDWHTATIEWLPDDVKFYLDGALIGATTDRVPSQPMHWVLQAETNTYPGDEPPDDAAGHVYLDWATAWVPEQTSLAGGEPRVEANPAAATQTGAADATADRPAFPVRQNHPQELRGHV
jgi:beta-glucanase (GH16 family)